MNHFHYVVAQSLGDHERRHSSNISITKPVFTISAGGNETVMAL
jgi:hypothetical protein